MWWLVLLPGVLVLLLVFVLPVLSLASNSLHLNAGLGKVAPELTLRNYWVFLTDPFYLGILLYSFQLGAIVVGVCIVLGYPVAYFLARTPSRWRGLMIFVVLAPLFVSVVIRNLGWLPLLTDQGLFNSVLLKLGILDRPLALINNFTGVVIGLVHALLPFMILSLMTVTQSIGIEIEEASSNLGAGPFWTFWHVILPMSKTGLVAGSLLVFTMAISAYTTPAVMGGKRVLVMATYIEQQFRAVLNYAFGATAAVVLMAVAAALTLLALRIAERGKA
jgi:putative spermidine/putrescine transport system permease protein